MVFSSHIGARVIGLAQERSKVSRPSHYSLDSFFINFNKGDMGGTSNNPFVPSICQTFYFVGRISSYDLDDYLISPPWF